MYNYVDLIHRMGEVYIKVALYSRSDQLKNEIPDVHVHISPRTLFHPCKRLKKGKVEVGNSLDD